MPDLIQPIADALGLIAMSIVTKYLLLHLRLIGMSILLQIVQLVFVECTFSIKRYEYKKSRIYALSVEPNCILDYGCRNSIMARV